MTQASSSSRFTTQSPTAPQDAPLIGALLRMASEEVRRSMLESLHAHGFDDLDAHHLNVLQYPGPDGVRPSELAAQLRISKQALNYKLGELERLDYLERRPDPDDRRSRRIFMTARGRELVPVVRGAVLETEREWADALGADRLEELRALLLELHDLESR